MSCPCGRPGTTRRESYRGVPYEIHDPCDVCAKVNRERLDLLMADSPSLDVLAARLLEPKS